MKKLSSFNSFFKIKVLFLDFDGVFTDNNVLVDENGFEYVSCSRYDGFGLSALKNVGVNPIVLTTETKPLARVRCKKLNIECYDALTDKYMFAQNYLKDNDYSFDEVCFLGNDINDLPLLNHTFLPVVTPDSHASVQYDHFYVTCKYGGKGCVRELADLIVNQH
ncbi:3-deoxy-D-manno-octulosonate 8-phosphate phosphatase [bacterium]|nr:3-deoxy-D-manno-octulosonate 8-phosphate phosphatase [bacterium]